MKKVLAILLAVCLLPVFAVPVSANAAPTTIWPGTDGAGIVVADENNPLVVEHELLTFDIGEFPTRDSTIENNATVTAQYTFYNPTDEQVTATLLFPFGGTPSYAYRYQEVYTEQIGDGLIDDAIDDTKQYGVLVDEKAVPMTVRHSLEPPYASMENPDGKFVLEVGLERLHEGPMENAFFSSELTVTQYTYSIHDLEDTRGWEYVVFPLDQHMQEGKTVLYTANGTYVGDHHYGAELSGYETELVLYAFGEPLVGIPQWKHCKSRSSDPETMAPARVELESTETMTFWEFALAGWQQDSGVSQADWYNLVVEEALWWSHGEIDRSIHLEGYRYGYALWTMRWYEYEITVQPKSRVVNTVTAPIYPEIDDSYRPEIYHYTYLLSPAQKWKSFGTLKVVVNTPYYILESNQGEFTKTENGYTLTLDGLPEGELEFSLSEKKWPIDVGAIIGNGIIALLGLLAIGMITYIVVGFIKKPKWKET